jgi:hypothetical protein
MPRDDFDWNDVANDIVIPEQAAIAVYNNPNGGIVCRQAGQYGPEEDSWIFFHPSHALTLAKAILEKAGLNDLVIVHVNHLGTQNGGGEVLAPSPDQDTIVRNAGRVADPVDDSDQPAETKKDKTAAERKRRQREKQRQRDCHAGTEAMSRRDIDRDTVTVTAPSLELDLQGGAHQALTH